MNNGFMRFLASPLGMATSFIIGFALGELLQQLCVFGHKSHCVQEAKE